MDDAIPASSLILLRDVPVGAPLILMARRSSSLVFAGGAFVFPGGRVDPADRDAAAMLFPALDAEEGAGRIAALRETLEETGIALAGWPDDPAAVHMLTPFARWRPEEKVPRRFDTRFYIARAPAEGDPIADGTETTHAFWATAADVLDRCLSGDGHAIFPTRRLLERLACFASFAEARAEALRLPDRVITPWIERRGQEDWLCIPEDAGYPVTTERAATAQRY